MEGIIYKYTNRLNGKVYIGQTINEQGRILNHKKCEGDSMFHRAIMKYGWENFNYEVVERVDESLLDEREIYWISYHSSNDKNFGYNLTSGGGGTRGYKYSDEQRKRRSEQLKGNTYWVGKIHSDETKKKLSDINKGKVFSEETKRKIGEANKGNTAFLGHHHSDETKKKLSEIAKHRKPTKGSTGMHWTLVDGKRIYTKS